MEQKKQDDEAKIAKRITREQVSTNKTYKNFYPQNMIDKMIRNKEQEEIVSRKAEYARTTNRR